MSTNIQYYPKSNGPDCCELDVLSVGCVTVCVCVSTASSCAGQCNNSLPLLGGRVINRLECGSVLEHFFSSFELEAQPTAAPLTPHTEQAVPSTVTQGQVELKLGFIRTAARPSFEFSAARGKPRCHTPPLCCTNTARLRF